MTDDEAAVQHVTRVVFQQGWQEWLASCTCGWTGSYFTDLERSEREAADHEARVGTRGPDGF